VVQLAAAAYLVIGALTGEMCVDLGGLLGGSGAGGSGRRLEAMIQIAKDHAMDVQGEGRKLQSMEICSDVPDGEISMHEITLGTGDGIDMAITCMIALACALIATILAIAASCFACGGKFAKVQCLLGTAMIFNVVYYIYMIPYDATDSIEIKPGYAWGATANHAAMFNMVIGMLAARSVAKAEKANSGNAGNVVV